MNDLKEIKEMLEEQNEKLDKICFAIYGNKEAKIKGIACILDDHDKYISKDKKFKWTVAGLFGGAIGGTWAGIVAYVKSHLGL